MLAPKKKKEVKLGSLKSYARSGNITLAGINLDDIEEILAEVPLESPDGQYMKNFSNSLNHRVIGNMLSLHFHFNIIGNPTHLHLPITDN